MVKPKTLFSAALAACIAGAAVAISVSPAQAFGFPRYGTYDYGPNVGFVAGNAIAAGSYPYYEDYAADPYGLGTYGAPYAYPYPGYGYYYGY